MCYVPLLSKALGQHGRAERPVCRCKGCSGHLQLLLAVLPHHNLPAHCGTTSTTVCSAPCAATALPQQRAAGVQPAPAPSLQQKPPNLLLLGAEDPTPTALETAGPNGATRDAPEPQPPLLLPILPHPFPGFPVVEVLLEVILPQRLQLRRVNDRFHVEHPWDQPKPTFLPPRTGGYGPGEALCPGITPGGAVLLPAGYKSHPAQLAPQ